MPFAADTARTLFIRSLLLIVNLVGGIINARWLGPQGVGIYVLLTLASQFSFRFANLGFGSGLAFFMANRRATFIELQRIVLTAGIVLSFVSCLILSAIWKNAYSPWHDIRAQLFYLSLTAVPLLFFRNFMTRLLSGQLKIKTMNISEIIYSFTYISLLICLVSLAELGVIGSLLSFLLAEAVVCLYLLFAAIEATKEADHNGIENRHRDLFLNIWRYGRWNYLILVLNFLLQQLPAVILKYFTSNTIIGLYSVSRGIINRTFILPNSFSEILFPYTAASDKATATLRTNRLCHLFLVLMSITAIILWLSIKYIIILLYGETFASSARIFYSLLPTLVAFPLFKFMNVHIAATGNSRLSLLAMLPGFASCLALCMVLIPAYGAFGAGLSVSGASIVLLVTNLVIYCKTTNSHFSECLFFNFNDLLWCKSALKKILKSHDNHLQGKMVGDSHKDLNKSVTLGR